MTTNDRTEDYWDDGMRVMLYGDPIAREVLVLAKALDLDPEELEKHVEHVHGWDRHEDGYAEAVMKSTKCLKAGKCLLN